MTVGEEFIDMDNQCKCGSVHFYVQQQNKNSPHYAAIRCRICDKWVKWVSKRAMVA